MGKIKTHIAEFLAETFLFSFKQVVKTGGTPKVPDCFQRTPKKLCIPEKAEILAVNVDSKGELFVFISLFVVNSLCASA